MKDAKGKDVHEALEELRAQKEKLEEEVCIKTELCNNLKKTQDDLLTKVKEAKLQSEKQAQELSVKSEELSTLTQLHQDLKSSFHEKESSFKQLNSAIERLRCEYGEKVQNFEEENKELVSALEEAKTNSESLKSKVDSSNMEIEDLKRVLLRKDKMLAEVCDKAQATKDLIQRDNVISKLEEKHRDVQDQLKWRNEQFQHLEEAHKKLQDTFKSSKIESENEKSLLLQEICSLQTNLDSQKRMSENLQSELRICNQALAHEQSSKKLLEVQISEYKSRFDDVFSECHEAKLTIEKLSHKRDEEVAELRDVLAAKDSLSKEMGYKLEHLEQENKDLIASLKEFQESQISNCGNAGSLKKLQKKYNSLEQVHKKCSEKLKEQVEFNSELEKIRKERDDYSVKLKDQSEQVIRLQEELKSCQCLPEVHNEAYIIRELEEQIRELENSHNQDDKNRLDVLSQKLVELEKENQFVESQKMQLETENQSLLHRVNEQTEKNVDLQQQLILLEKFITERTEAETKENEQKLKIIEDKEATIKSLSKVIEEKNQRIEELVKDAANALLISEVKQKLEAEFSNLCEKVKLKDEALLKSTQRVDELEELLRINKSETENLMNEKTRMVNRVNILEAQNQVLYEEKQILEDEISGLFEKVKVKDESLLKSTQRGEELEDTLKAKNLETENLMNEKALLVNRVNILEAKNQVIYEEKQKLEADFSNLCGEVKAKDEILLKSSQRAEELEDILRANKLETENVMNEKTRLLNLVNNLEAQNHVLYEEKQKLEDEISSLCEKVKVKDESLLKSTQRAEELEDFLQANKLETENLMNEKAHLVNRVNDLEAQNQVLYEEKQKLEDEISGLYEKVKVKDESLLKSTQRTDKLEDLLQANRSETENLLNEKLALVNRVNNLEAENQGLYEEKQKLEAEYSNLCEKVKVQDESLLKSTQRAGELEELLRINTLDTKNLMDEKTRVVNRVNNLEAQNKALYEDIGKIILHRDDLLIQMETASKQMEEYLKDVELTRMLENMLQKC